MGGLSGRLVVTSLLYLFESMLMSTDGGFACKLSYVLDDLCDSKDVI